MSEAVSRECDAVVPPSSLFVFWPGDEPPLAEEIRYRLLEWGQVAKDEDNANAEETLWSFWLELADRPASCFVWCEAVTGAHLRMLDGVRWRSKEQESAAKQCRWMVGIEGAISLKEPVADYLNQLRLCESISRDWAPVIYDASSFRFRTPEDVRHLLASRTLPRTSCLFTVHKVADPRTRSEESLHWLHTHGLERAGIPDLEMFNVPARLIPAACELLEAVAELWLEFGTPEPQTPFAIGNDLEIAWRPWQVVVAESANDLVGGWRYRNSDLGHAGYRAVLVGPGVSGWIRKRWIPPLVLLERMTATETTLYKTSPESRRMAKLARERWGSFGLLFASQRPQNWRFAVKLGYPMTTDPQHLEHLWYDVVAIQPGKILGKLLSTPACTESQSLGQTEWHPLDRLSDWRIVTPDGVFDPESAESLLE
ncbi:MAG: DUF4026 domain-containing protein [Planctomycetota bacterium]